MSNLLPGKEIKKRSETGDVRSLRPVLASFDVGGLGFLARGLIWKIRFVLGRWLNGITWNKGPGIRSHGITEGSKMSPTCRDYSRSCKCERLGISHRNCADIPPPPLTLVSACLRNPSSVPNVLFSVKAPSSNQVFEPIRRPPSAPP